MRRKKDPQTQPVDPAKFWPVPGVDGEPYPPRVQEALDLIAAETKRLKIRECKHEGRYPTHVTPGWEGLHSRPYHVCACRDCGAERIACIPNQECDYSRRRTPNYGFPYERREAPPRRTGTDWLKTEEQEQREARTDRMVSRQIRRASTRLPLMITTDGDPGTKPGALERAITRAVERDLQESTQVDRVRRVSSWDKEVRRVQELLNEAERYSEGAMARSAETYILRKANGEMVLQVTEDRAPDLSWVRTMNGKQQLR